MSTTVTTQAQLAAAIQAADAAVSGPVVIELGNAIQLTSALPAIALNAGVSLTIDGGATDIGINANGQRGLIAASGAVTLSNLSIYNAAAQGAAGSAGGGGGGAGLGAGLFIASAGAVTLNNVTFANDSAIGGA